MKTREQIKEAFDLVGIMGASASEEAKRYLGYQYDVLAWLLCDGESAEPFEKLLEIGRNWMRGQNAQVTRVMPSGRTERGADYRKNRAN